MYLFAYTSKSQVHKMINLDSSYVVFMRLIIMLLDNIVLLVVKLHVAFQNWKYCLDTYRLLLMRCRKTEGLTRDIQLCSKIRN